MYVYIVEYQIFKLITCFTWGLKKLKYFSRYCVKYRSRTMDMTITKPIAKSYSKDPLLHCAIY